MTMTSQAPTIDRADAEATLYRVAICAFTYHPGKQAQDPGYTIDDDVNWCLAPIAGLPAARLVALSETIRIMITEPTANRREFIAMLAALADG
jgi:hypothetical protein